MHSRIFVLSKDKDAKIEDFNVSWLDDPQTIHPSVDYIGDSEDVVRDIEWMEELYQIKIKIKDNIGEIDKDNIAKLKGSLQKMTRDNIKKSHKRLEKIISDSFNYSVIDLAQVANLLYPRLGFYFIVDEGMSVCNEVELLEWLQMERPTELYVIHTYDYHF